MPEDQIQKAVKLGINKLNIGTEYNQGFYRELKAALDGKKHEEYILSYLVGIKPDIKESLRRKLAV